MDDIIEPTIDYDFSKLYLGPPSTLTGGSYFTRIMYNNNKHLFIQTPKCISKQGFIKSGKKVYTDLMFNNNDTILINWIENLETTIQELLFKKSDTWFENKLEKDDIEAAFTSPLKIYKSGKYYLLRVNVKPNIKIYNENDEVMNIEDINSEHNIISILEIQGVKFSNRNFQIEMELKQSLVVSPDPFLDECFIKKPVKKSQTLEKEKDTILEKDKDTILEKEKDTILEKNEDNILNNFIEESLEDLKKSNEYASKPIISKIDINEEKNNNLKLEIENVDLIEDPNILKEFDVSESLENNLETITLKKPNEVYYEIYQKAREKAKEAKQAAILAYLELKNIKKTYMLEDMSDSDGDSEFMDDEELED
jgi:uncharacterized membrane protein